MTSRVFECRTGPIDLDRSRSRRRVERTHKPRGFWPAVFVAVLLVPLAGAAERPAGWAVAVAAAALVLVLYRATGGHAPWGLLAVLAGAAGIFAPRDQLAGVGPGFFVATVLLLVVWLANRGPREQLDEQPRPGSPERRAQVVMGFSGEHHVGQVLARELPQDYVLLNGLQLNRAAGDIDHLVVGPSGVFVLETKTMAGRITCASDGTWTRTKIGRAGTQYPAFVGDPASQALRNVMALRNYLRSRVPRLFDRGNPLWIDGLLVFPHPRTELDTAHSPVPALRLADVVPYICSHTPRRGLQRHEVEAIVAALLAETEWRPRPAAQSAQALVELALGVPIVLALLFGTVALSRIVQAHSAVVVIAHEVARAGALGNSAADALLRMQDRVQEVAPGLGLDPHSVNVECDVSQFARRDGRVAALARYTVDLGALPLAGWVPSPTVVAEHVEWVDPYRAGIGLPVEASH